MNWGVALAATHKRFEAAEKLNEALELKPELKPMIEKIRKRCRIPSGR